MRQHHLLPAKLPGHIAVGGLLDDFSDLKEGKGKKGGDNDTQEEGYRVRRIRQFQHVDDDKLHPDDEKTGQNLRNEHVSVDFLNPTIRSPLMLLVGFHEIIQVCVVALTMTIQDA